MSDIIQCPQCDKKFRLPPSPPATYACNGCGTVMDLSDFGGADQPDEAPAEPARESSGGGGEPRSRRTRRRGGGRRGAAPPPGPAASPSRSRGGRRARGGAGRRGRGAPVDDYGDEERPSYRGRARQGNSTALIIGSIAALVAAVVLIIVTSSGGDDPAGGTKAADADDKDKRKGGLMDLNPTGVPTGLGAELTGDKPEGEGDEESELVKSGKRAGKGKRIRLSKVQVKRFPWPEEVDEATRTKVEEAIVNLYRGGRDALDAIDYLEAQGRPICGRLISEFKAIEESPGIESREGKSRLGALDSLLRKIDGWIERRWDERGRVQPHSSPSFVMGQLRRWTYWWESEEWKINPRKPWDPMVDESDETEDGIARPLEDPKKEGFSKPAGR